MKRLRVLIACECSQTVCAAFRALGDECYSCDIEEQYGGHPEWHVKRNVLDLLSGDIAFTTQDGTDHCIGEWDLVIAHPPCTYLCAASPGPHVHSMASARSSDPTLRFWRLRAKSDVPVAAQLAEADTNQSSGQAAGARVPVFEFDVGMVLRNVETPTKGTRPRPKQDFSWYRRRDGDTVARMACRAV